MTYYEREDYVGPLNEDGSIPACYWDDPQYWTVTAVEEKESSEDSTPR